jgi:hypothetical protein
LVAEKATEAVALILEAAWPPLEAAWPPLEAAWPPLPASLAAVMEQLEAREAEELLGRLAPASEAGT